jgi:CDP-diacylglycerol--glycerol-3-phosphate 3-phosphatidyltransferase/CDP-diacylglycerol--serine O-phosphatidyltransferase
MQSNNRHLANIITLIRILGVILIFWFTPYKTNLMLIWTVIIYTFVCLTDIIDGWVARKLNIVSDIGKILDPLADKIVVLVLLPLLEMQVITSLPVFIILAREFAIMGLRVAAAKTGTIIPAYISGKIKTGVTLPVCGILFARATVEIVPNLPPALVPLDLLRQWIYQWPTLVFNILIWTTVVITLWSFLDYFRSFIWQQYVIKAGGDEKKAKKFLYMLIPNFLTLVNLGFGSAAVIFAAFKMYHITVVLVLLGMFLDAIDGKLARKFETVTKFGAKLDSRADFISFGIAPAVIIFGLLSAKINCFYNLPCLAIAIGYYGAVHFRLHRFDQKGHSDYFTGLPSPIGASFIVLSAISFYLSQVVVFIPIIIIVSLLMVSKIPYPHMDVATKRTFMRYLKIPAFIFFVLTILNLLDINLAKNLLVYEILFGLSCTYVISPLLLIKKKQ